VTYRLGETFDCRTAGADGLTYTFRTGVSSWERPTRVDAGYRADVVGTTGSDHITVRAPRVRLTGRGGGDALAVSPYAKTKSSVVRGDNGTDVITGGKRSDRLYGGAGRDTLIGQRGDDVLVGGPGPDVARGGSGRDTCSAETLTRCEAPRT
jgi:Ca2+-binding RTX toxin-like protein